MENTDIAVAAQQVDELNTIQEIIKSFFLDEELTKEQKDFLVVNSQRIQEFLDAPLDSPKDVETKKIFAKVILLAKQKGILPDNMKPLIPDAQPNETAEEKKERIEETAQTVAVTVDEGVDKVKTNYKVGIGEMLAQQAFERAVDKAAVKVAQVADKVVDKGFNWLINKGAVAVERIFPKLIPVVEVAKRVLIAAKPVVRAAVRTGVKIVAVTVKKAIPAVIKTAKKVWTGVKSVAKSAWNGLKRIASWLGF